MLSSCSHCPPFSLCSAQSCTQLSQGLPSTSVRSHHSSSNTPEGFLSPSMWKPKSRQWPKGDQHLGAGVSRSWPLSSPSMLTRRQLPSPVLFLEWAKACPCPRTFALAVPSCWNAPPSDIMWLFSLFLLYSSVTVSVKPTLIPVKPQPPALLCSSPVCLLTALSLPSHAGVKAWGQAFSARSTCLAPGRDSTDICWMNEWTTKV